jgi:cell division protein FtsI (penicillin-binding protein 3)
MNARGLILTVFAVAWCVAITAKLYAVQVVDHSKYEGLARRQQLRIKKMEPPRGMIFDAHKRTLAVSLEVDSVGAFPEQVDNPKQVASTLEQVLGVDAGTLLEELSKGKSFVWLARRLDHAVASEIERLQIPGISVEKERKRYYPLREVAAQVIGFSGVDDTGLAGIESRYDAVLTGEAVRRTLLFDALKGTLLSPRMSLDDASPGRDVYLTIDAHIQYLLETELRLAVERHRAKKGMAILMDPSDGAILAMTSWPSFDPNSFQSYTPALHRNGAVIDSFEPGSTFKIVTAAAAFESNLLDPSDVIDCEMGGITLAGVRINDHHPFGLLSFQQVLAKSSNVGTIKAGLLVGERRLYEQIRRFGFGSPTGIDLPGGTSSRGIVHPVERWHDRATAYISFGQGVSVTALQLVNAFASVANGGTLYRPYVVSAIGKGVDMEATHAEPEVLGYPISASTARTLGRLLESVVDEGTGKKAAIPGYRVAGKTGTAQKPSAGGYSSNRYLASFAGFAPSREPAVVGLIIIDEPTGPRYHGGDVAADVFSRVVGQVLSYLGVPPTRNEIAEWPAEDLRMPDTGNSQLSIAENSEQIDSTLMVSQEVFDNQIVPDFSGLTAREALTRSGRLGLKVRMNGQGFVAEQQPLPGTELAQAMPTVELWLTAPIGS